MANNWANFRNEGWYKNGTPIQKAAAEVAYMWSMFKSVFGIRKK